MWWEWGIKGKVNRLLVRKTEGKKPPGRPRWKWVDDIKTDLAQIALGGVD
jgi:hypothetical protein